MSTAAEIDPFAGADKAPSISFKNKPLGTVYEGVVTEAPKLVQSRDYDTGDPAFWPAKPGETPSPKMSVVIRILMEDGEERTVWAQKPSAMFAAIGEAQKQAGQRIDIGGTLAVKFIGEKPHTDPVKIKKEMPPQKLYAAKYTPPPARPADDPWASSAANTAAPAASAADDTPPF